MDIVETLRLIARGFTLEKATNSQAKSAVPALEEAASEIETLRKELEHLKDRETKCPTILEAEARSLLRALQEIAEAVGLDASNSPRETVAAIKSMVA